MKNFALTTIAILLLSSCMSYQDYVVESDYSYKGKFKDYKSFSFQTEINPNLKNHPMKVHIENAIKARMELQGYTYDDQNPNIYIAYRMFYNDFSMTGYKQPLLEEWIRRGEDEETYDPVKLGLKKGTLMVILRDINQENTVWQGYASSIFGNENCDNDRYVKQVVRSIFDQYRVFANNLVADNRRRN